VRILVTGPDGFIGSAVCRDLVQKGYSVRGAQWQQAPLPEGCESFIVGDIGEGTEWMTALAGVDAVVHLAARVHVMHDRAADPLAEFRSVNVHGTRKLAEAAAQAGVEKFIFLSSVKVNGEHTVLPDAEKGHEDFSGGRVLNRRAGAFTATDEPRPEDPYGISKWEAEQYLREIELRTGMKVTILRPTLVYGPGVKANFLKLVQCVERGIPLPFGCIRNKRSFIGLGNLIDIICRCLEHPSAAGETFLVSDGDDVSTPELIRRIARAFGKEPRLLPVPEWVIKAAGIMTGKSDQVQRLCGSLQVDSSRLQRSLNWRAPYTMADELERVARWRLGN